MEGALDRALKALRLGGRGAMETESVQDWVVESIDQVMEVTAGTH